MAEEDKPPFLRVVIWAALIIGFMVAILIVMSIQWQMADGLGLGWDRAYYIRDRTLLVSWGIVVPAILITIAIIGSKIYKQTEIITLIFGIGIAATGTLLAIVSGVQIGRNFAEYFNKLGTGIEFFYIFFLIMAVVGVFFSIMLALSGKNLISYYYTKQA
ncbi:MAG: hypothetical protein ACTSRS_15335 [Candidatus Helarchaeota archaeon]